MNRAAVGLSILALGTVMAVCDDAAALLIERTEPYDWSPYLVFYPYPTTFTQIDARYLFDDDPLSAFVHRPFLMPIVVPHPPVRPSMVTPRTSFVEEMFRSAGAL